MAKFALIKNGVFVEARNYDRKPPDIPHKNAVWLPFVTEEVNNAVTQNTKRSVEAIIEPDRYVVRTTITDKSQAEIDAEVEQAKEQAAKAIDSGYTLLRALGLVLFGVVNDVRELKGQQPITAQQFRNFVKGKL